MRNTVGFEEQLLVALDPEDLAYVADAVPADVIDEVSQAWRRRIDRFSRTRSSFRRMVHR